MKYFILVILYSIVNVQHVSAQLNSAYNICPANTVDLTTHVQGIPPVGTIITWHSALPTTDMNKISNPTSVSNGIYYATYNDTLNNCYSGDGNTALAIRAVVNTCPIDTIYSAYNICPANTVDLTTHVQGIPPVGTIVTWHSALPTTDMNKILNPTSVSNGIYYATYNDTLNNCYSGDGNTALAIRAVVNTCPIDTIYSAYNICPTNTVDLTTHVQGIPPVGTIVTWHSALPTTDMNKILNPTSVSNGIYYAVYNDTLNNCYSGDGYAAMVVRVTINMRPETPSIPAFVRNTCPAKAVNLNGIMSGLPPSVSGGIFEWRVSDNPNSTLLINPMLVNAGTYYLFEKSPTNCYSEGTAIQVQIQNCCPYPECIPVVVLRNRQGSIQN